MSKLSKAADKLKEVNSLRPEEIVTNYMGGDSYVINPLDTLKMVSASSIFAEPSYYRSSKSSRASVYEVNPLVAKDSIIDHTYKGMTTDEIMEAWEKAYQVIADIFISVEKEIYETRK